MPELILLRHGESEGNTRGTYQGWADTELNELGIKQAKQVKQKLRNEKIGTIFCSTLLRAKKTAEIINENFDLPIKYSDNLKERNYGIWENMSHKDIAWNYPKEYDMWLKDWVNYTINEGESALQANNRIVKFIDSTIKNNINGNILIVTHLGCIRSIVAHLLNMSIGDSWRFKVDNGSITRFEFSESYPILTVLGAH